MEPNQVKIELISWIASLKQTEWLNQLLLIKKQLEKNLPSPSHKQASELRGYGKYANQIIMSDDFDEPLSDFQDYM